MTAHRWKVIPRRGPFIHTGWSALDPDDEKHVTSDAIVLSLLSSEFPIGASVFIIEAGVRRHFASCVEWGDGSMWRDKADVGHGAMMHFWCCDFLCGDQIVMEVPMGTSRQRRLFS